MEIINLIWSGLAWNSRIGKQLFAFSSISGLLGVLLSKKVNVSFKWCKIVSTME